MAALQQLLFAQVAMDFCLCCWLGKSSGAGTHPDWTRQVQRCATSNQQGPRQEVTVVSMQICPGSDGSEFVWQQTLAQVYNGWTRQI